MYLAICIIVVISWFVQPLEFDIKGEGNLITYLYFSVVTFTTLGFGDVTPLNTPGKLWVMIEVILGYAMLGILIGIGLNKIARRS